MLAIILQISMNFEYILLWIYWYRNISWRNQKHPKQSLKLDRFPSFKIKHWLDFDAIYLMYYFYINKKKFLYFPLWTFRTKTNTTPDVLKTFPLKVETPVNPWTFNNPRIWQHVFTNVGYWNIEVCSMKSPFRLLPSQCLLQLCNIYALKNEIFNFKLKGWLKGVARCILSQLNLFLKIWQTDSIRKYATVNA